MLREHEEFCQRELSLGDALDADATDELAILAPARRGARSSRHGSSRFALRARNESLHLGVVGAATEIDEPHLRPSTAGQPAVAVRRRDVLGIAGVRLLRLGRCRRNTGAMPLGQLGFGIDHIAAGARSHREDGARAVTRADEHVLRPRRAVDEVPGREPPLLTLDQEQAFAREHQEVLLLVLSVVHARGLAGSEDADVDAHLGKARIRAFEPRIGAEVSVEPAALLCVDDEPSLGCGHDALRGRLVRRFGDHGRFSHTHDPAQDDPPSQYSEAR